MYPSPSTHTMQYIGKRINVHAQCQCVVNGVFDWNRMTVGIHAGFPLLKSAIRLTVYGIADVLAHLNDLQPAHVCVCVHARLSTGFPMIYSSRSFLYTIYEHLCAFLYV